MKKRKGYTKKVLEAQIGKYKKALKMNNDDFYDWVYGFGSWSNCPVCYHRDQFRTHDKDYACRLSGVEPCLAIVNNVRCDSQYWFKVVSDGGRVNFTKIRRNLAKRLKFWQRIYAEKYPVKS